MRENARRCCFVDSGTSYATFVALLSTDSPEYQILCIMLQFHIQDSSRNSPEMEINHTDRSNDPLYSHMLYTKSTRARLQTLFLYQEMSVRAPAKVDVQHICKWVMNIKARQSLQAAWHIHSRALHQSDPSHYLGILEPMFASIVVPCCMAATSVTSSHVPLHPRLQY